MPAVAAEVMHVAWDNLTMVSGRMVRVWQPEGVITEKATGVEADAPVVDVKSTTDPKVYPKGLLRVPRAKLHIFDVQHR